MILTSYFTRKTDPQRGIRHRPDNPHRLKLIAGARANGVPVTVFHDELSDGFVREHSDDLIRFERIAQFLDGMSCNDFRFIAYQKFLMNNDVGTVWCVDLFDVLCQDDPDKMFNLWPPGRFEIFAGAHNDWKINGPGPDGKFVCDRIKAISPGRRIPPSCDQKPILMAGTWGGEQEFVMDFLEIFCANLRAKPAGNRNLPLFNVIAWEHFADRLWAGTRPLVSAFRKNQVGAPVIFVHK